jgi:hypothetical protein
VRYVESNRDRFGLPLQQSKTRRWANCGSALRKIAEAGSGDRDAGGKPTAAFPYPVLEAASYQASASVNLVIRRLRQMACPQSNPDSMLTHGNC